jgi:signal transduction histidine kinase
VRDFTARYGVNAELHADGDFSALPEAYSTCVYRAVQEALTNSARHAKASSIRVNVTGHTDHLDVSIADNGVGIDPARRRSGLGLRGIEERVKELRGTVTIGQATPSGGTTVAIHLPLPVGAMEVPRARVAG